MVLAIPCGAQSSLGMSLSAEPEILLPLGEAASVSGFELGYGGRIGASFRLPPLPALALKAEVAGDLIPFAGNAVSLLRGGLGAVLALSPAPIKCDEP